MDDYTDRVYRHGKPTRHLQFANGKLQQMYIFQDNIGASYRAPPVNIWLDVLGQEDKPHEEEG